MINVSRDPKVSIVIHVFNKVELTRNCVEALYETVSSQTSFEVVVVDNGSTDATPQFLSRAARKRLNFRVITNEKNLGFAKACNIGARTSRGQYILFLNNDTKPCSGWLDSLIDILDDAPSVGAVGSKLLFPDGTIQHAGIIIVDDRKSKDPLAPRHVFYGAAGDLEKANKRREYKALTAACVLMRRTAFDSVSGFDEGYWNGYEDVDLCFKLVERNWRLVYQPQSVVVHFESKSGMERFSKIKENTQRLHARWLGKIRPDCILRQEAFENGVTVQAEYLPPEFLTSIIILTHNQIEDTKKCLRSIEAHTPEPHELIIIDNGSTDGTKDYLLDYMAHQDQVRVVLNTGNRGFAAGNNQGLSLARGDYILLLNNDTVVTPGWLGGMLSVFDRYPAAGIVGPVSNNVSGVQLVENVPYDDTKEVSGFAATWNETHKGQTIEATRVVGFCLLARKSVIDRVGGLDEQFETGNFEDDDFCYRAAMAGYKTRIAKDVFVHHTGGQTFKGARIDWRRNMERNWERFKAKWGINKDVPLGEGYRIPWHDPDVSRYFIPVSADRLLADHHPDNEKRLWKEGHGPIPSSRVITFFVREDSGMDTLKGALQSFSADIANFSDWQAKSVSEILEGAGRSQYILLLSPDVILPKGGLKNLVAVADSDGTIGAVGPTANTPPSTQRVKQGYKSLKKELQKFVRRRTHQYKKSWSAVSYLGSFCLLLKTEALRRVGGLDTGLPLPKSLWGLYLRLRDQGFKVALAKGVYVHHHQLTDDEGANFDVWAEEGRSFAETLSFDSIALHEEEDPEVGRKDQHVEYSPPGVLPKAPTVSVCMIVRDEQKVLRRCLKSVRDIANELIVVDTGSQDATISIAKEFGAKVFEFEWCDDFSAARNEAIKNAWGDWIFQIDADEELLPDSARFLKKRISDPWSLVSMVTVDNGPTYSERFFKTGRLFRNHPQIEYSRPYHETIEPSADNLMVSEPGWRIVYDSKIVIRHYGYEGSAREEKGKLERELRMLETYVKDNPRDQSMRTRLAELYDQLGRYDEAIAVCKEALVFNPDYVAAHHVLGMAYCGQGRLDEGVAQYKKALAIDRNLPWVRYHLGVVYKDRGDYDKAIEEFQRALELSPNLGKVRTSLGVAFHMKGMKQEAFTEYQRALAINAADAEAHFNLGVLYRYSGMLDEAITEYEKALADDPDFAEAHNNLAVAYFMKKKYDMAIKYSDEAVQRGFEVNPKFLEDLECHRK